MAELTHPFTFPLQENPLRERRVIFRRYGINALFAVLLLMMAYHIFVVETDWARMGGIREIIETAAEFWPDMAFFPTIIGVGSGSKSTSTRSVCRFGIGTIRCGVSPSDRWS